MSQTERKKKPISHLKSEFIGDSLTDRRLLRETGKGRVIRMLPEVNVLKIGGQSIIDRGKKAVYPILEEIVKNKKKHKIIIGTGGGTRSRHAYSIAMDLGLPTGVIAKLGGSISRQNARMIQMLLAKDGGLYIPNEHIEELPLYLASGCIPILIGMPPYEYWEKPTRKGRIPGCRTDAGVYLLAEVFGARSMIFIKDEDGLYTADPKKNSRAKFIPKISVEELIELDFSDIIIERAVLKFMLHARHAKKIQIINGLKKGNITRALNGEQVGTIIYSSSGNSKE